MTGQIAAAIPIWGGIGADCRENKRTVACHINCVMQSRLALEIMLVGEGIGEEYCALIPMYTGSENTNVGADNGSW